MATLNSSTQFPSGHTQGLDPKQGFNIKTDFPKMENKKIGKDKSTEKKIQESHLKEKQIVL